MFTQKKSFLTTLGLCAMLASTSSFAAEGEGAIMIGTVLNVAACKAACAAKDQGATPTCKTTEGGCNCTCN